MAENEQEFPLSYSLSSISVIESLEYGGDECQLDEVNLYFNEVNQVVTLKPIADTDEVEISHQTLLNLPLMIETPSWAQCLVGKKLDMVWVCHNQQGYQDLVILAFEYLHPNIGFLAEGSVLKVVQSQMVKRINGGDTHDNSSGNENYNKK